MRSVNDSAQFTPFGLWIREYLRPSNDGFSVTNLDYVFEDYKNKRIMLVEEKQSGGRLHKSQLLTFNVLDRHLHIVSQREEYDYWGFFIVAFPKGKTMVGPGVTLNDKLISVEDLVRHLNFEQKYCAGYWFPWRDKY